MSESRGRSAGPAAHQPARLRRGVALRQARSAWTTSTSERRVITVSPPGRRPSPRAPSASGWSAATRLRRADAGSKVRICGSTATVCARPDGRAHAPRPCRCLRRRPRAQDLVALAELLALELEDARRRRVGLAAQPVALPWGTSASPLVARRRGWPLASRASSFRCDDVKPQVARERRELETERGGELGAAVEAAELEEVQRLAERIGGRGQVRDAWSRNQHDRGSVDPPHYADEWARSRTICHRNS